MAGQSEAAWVRVAVPIAEEEVGRSVEPCQCFQDRRDLAEGKKTRHVGENELPFGGRLLERLETGERERCDRRSGKPPMAIEVGVDPGHRSGIPELVFSHDAVAEALLDADGFPRRDGPDVAIGIRGCGRVRRAQRFGPL
jgi:hypothetical protein